jgi:hypothetical protein
VRTFNIAGLAAAGCIMAAASTSALAQAQAASGDKTTAASGDKTTAASGDNTKAAPEKSGPLGDGMAQHAANAGQARPDVINKAVGPDEFSKQPGKPK